MKLFVAEKREKGYVSELDYHWCEDDEILMFGEFQTEDNRIGKDVSMCGIQSRRFTTHILVKDLDIPKDYILELITESVEKSMNCEVNEDGSYVVELSEAFRCKFNINDTLTELTDKAEKFEVGEKVICRGRVITRTMFNKKNYNNNMNN